MKMDVFFDRSNLAARTAQTTCTTYTTDTSFESPDIQFLGARRTEGVAPKQSQHAPLSEINWISFKWAWRLSLGATPFVLLAPRSWISGLSYEVSFALEFWVADHLQTKTSNWESAYAVLYVQQCILLIFKRCTLRGTCTLQKRVSKLLMNSNGYPFKASIVFKRDPVQTMMGNSNQLVVTNLLCSPY